MAEVYKTLGQLDAAATTLETLYTVPGGGVLSAVLTTITVCNRGSTNTTFRVAIRVAGAGIDNKQYIYYDAAIPANETFCRTVGDTIATTDVVSVYAGNGNLSFNLSGTEIS